MFSEDSSWPPCVRHGPPRVACGTSFTIVHGSNVRGGNNNGSTIPLPFLFVPAGRRSGQRVTVFSAFMEALRGGRDELENSIPCNTPPGDNMLRTCCVEARASVSFTPCSAARLPPPSARILQLLRRASPACTMLPPRLCLSVKESAG